MKNTSDGIRCNQFIRLVFVSLVLSACAQAPNYAPVKTVNQINLPTDVDANHAAANKSTHQSTGSNVEKTVAVSGQTNKKGDISHSTDTTVGKTQAKYIRHAEFAGNPAKKNQKNFKMQSTLTAGKKNGVSKYAHSAPEDKEKVKQTKSIAGNIGVGLQSVEQVAEKTRKTESKRSESKTKIDNEKSTISIDNKKMLKLRFQWPIRGKIARNFSQTENKGIDIIGKQGQAVHAAESGKAVYCGNGLKGYGNLAIIKHDEAYLSAYANNSSLFIREGQEVKKGQKIGQIANERVKNAILHFEIRKHGKPVNPLPLLTGN